MNYLLPPQPSLSQQVPGCGRPSASQASALLFHQTWALPPPSDPSGGTWQSVERRRARPLRRGSVCFCFNASPFLPVCLSFLSGVYTCNHYVVSEKVHAERPAHPSVLISPIPGRPGVLPLISVTTPFPFCFRFSFEEELGPAAPGVPGAEAVVPEQRRPARRQVQRLRGGGGERVHLRVTALPQASLSRAGGRAGGRPLRGAPGSCSGPSSLGLFSLLFLLSFHFFFENRNRSMSW